MSKLKATNQLDNLRAEEFSQGSECLSNGQRLRAHFSRVDLRSIEVSDVVSRCQGKPPGHEDDEVDN